MVQDVIAWVITVPCAAFAIGMSIINLRWLRWRLVRRQEYVSPILGLGTCAVTACSVVCPEPRFLAVWLTMIGLDMCVVLLEVCGAAWEWWHDAR
jgi:hypothetical protein